jgi:hypothetical protein
MNLNTKEVMERSEVFKSKGGTQLNNKTISSSRRGTHHNNIIYVDQKINSNLRLP